MSGHVLCWKRHNIYYNQLDPAWQEEVHAELSRVLDGRAPTMANLVDLPKMEATITENLRLNPVAPLVFHANTDTVMLRDYVIPANTMVLINVYHINRDPEVFPDPDTFNPRRWISEAVSYTHLTLPTKRIV